MIKSTSLRLMALGAIVAMASCCTQKGTDAKAGKDGFTAPNHSKAIVDGYASSITKPELTEQLYAYASDEMEGRYTGSAGQKKAVAFLKAKYEEMGVAGGMPDGSYYQNVPASYMNNVENDSENVLAFIEGSQRPEEVIVLSAHLDHIGVEDGEVFNGADDDGSGTIALIEIAEAFKKAKDEGKGPARSILFLHVTGEELGLYGSKYYSEHPIYPLANTIANLNIDMIGRIDPDQVNDPDYIYLIGSDMLSQDLHDVSEMANEKYVDIRLDYRYNGKDDPNRFYYRSDHYNFAKNNVPVIFYFNGVHEDYHRATDTPDKIEYDLYLRRTKLIFYTAWELANAAKRPALK